jgi:DNA-damage-inducible protein J
MKLPQNKPLSIEELSDEQFNVEIEKGMDDLNNGKVVSAESVFDRISKDYGL